MDKITYMPHIIFLYFCPNLANILSNFVAFSGRIKHVDLTSRAHSHPKNLLVFVRDSEGGRGVTVQKVTHRDQIKAIHFNVLTSVVASSVNRSEKGGK
jgi:hypothetical protein